jgi:DNA-binding HxlR family transcriptional regulator
MPKRRRRSDCPIHFALETFGDRWTLLVLRDLLLKGRSTYTEFLGAGEGIATNILADRLERLQQDQLVERLADGSYQATDKAIDLLPVLVEMITWSAKHDPETATPAEFVDRAREDRDALLDELRGALASKEEQPQ